MSNDSKYTSSNNDLKKDEINSPEITNEHKNKNSSSTLEINKTNSGSISPKSNQSNSPQNSRLNSPKNARSSSPKNNPSNSSKNSQSNSPKTSPPNSPKNNPLNSQKNSRPGSPKISRSSSPKNNPLNSEKNSRSHSPKTPERKATNEIITTRPLSPVVRYRVIKQQNSTSANKQRTRSQSPQKTFSYLSPDRLNSRKWKLQRRYDAKQEEDQRIYHENIQKLHRLAKIAKEPSSYPTLHIEQERLRERHAIDQRRKVLKSYIPILKDNLCIVDRLANVKGVYDVNRMKEDFNRHTQILKQDAANRQKARETAAQRPFILPKINLKS